MSKPISDRTLVFTFVSLMVVALAGYAVLADSAKEKTSIGSIGTLSIALVPNATISGTETVKITFEAPGQWDFSGWTISNDDGFSYTIDVDPIAQNDSVLICGSASAGFACDDVWGATNVFPDANGSFVLKDTNGTVISNVADYGTPEPGAKIEDFPDLMTTIYSGNAQVTYCRNAQQGYTSQKATVGNIVGGKGQTAPGKGSIVPSFHYDMDPGIGYYPGLNWPDTSGVYANGCS